MSEAAAPAPGVFQARMQALDAVLAAARGRGVLAGADIRDTSNRSGRDWPWWSVEVSRTYAHWPETYRLAATVRQACTAEQAVGELEGSWRTEVWLDVAANRLDLSGRQRLAYGDLATPDALLAVVEALLDHARAALLSSGRRLPSP